MRIRIQVELLRVWTFFQQGKHISLESEIAPNKLNNGHVHFNWKYQEEESHHFLSIIQLSEIPFRIISYFYECENLFVTHLNSYKCHFVSNFV